MSSEAPSSTHTHTRVIPSVFLSIRIIVQSLKKNMMKTAKMDCVCVSGKYSEQWTYVKDLYTFIATIMRLFIISQSIYILLNTQMALRLRVAISHRRLKISLIDVNFTARKKNCSISFHNRMKWNVNVKRFPLIQMWCMCSCVRIHDWWLLTIEFLLPQLCVQCEKLSRTLTITEN